MGDIKNKLSQILAIINFPSDQQEPTISGIVDLINEYTLIRLLRDLNQETQIAFREMIGEQKDRQEFIISFLKKYYSTETIQKTVREEAKNLICDYIKTISPMITDEEKNKIKEILENCE